jgi:hypothetical protein
VTLEEITTDISGQNVNGIHVVKITDGTLNTTFKHHIYGWRDKKNVLIRDPISGKAITTTSRQMLHGNEQRGIHGMCAPELLKTLPDEDDKRIWWDDNPKYVTRHFKNKEGIAESRKIYVGAGKNMVVGTWDEFLEAVNAREVIEPEDGEIPDHPNPDILEPPKPTTKKKGGHKKR